MNSEQTSRPPRAPLAPPLRELLDDMLADLGELLALGELREELLDLLDPHAKGLSGPIRRWQRRLSHELEKLDGRIDALTAELF